MIKKTFEQAISDLESIAAKLENEKIGLEDSIKNYEEAKKLIEFCEASLQNARQKITYLN